MKRRAFFLLETGKASTTSTKRIRGLIILTVLLSVTGAMVETTVVEVADPTFRYALYMLGFTSEMLAAAMMLVDLVMRTWACTVDSRLSKHRTFVPGVWKSNDRPGCSVSCGPPPGALEVDSLGHVVNPDEPHQDERPRRCGVKCIGRLQYTVRPWNILELSTFVPVLIWVVSAGSLPVFGLSQWAHGLRFLRLLRVVVLRRMFAGVRLLFKVVTSKARELSSALMMALIVSIIVGSAVYELERPRAAKTPFRTLFDGAYWSTISLSTVRRREAGVGFGDVAPQRLMGRIVTTAAVAVLVGVFTLPAGVISSGFVELTDRARHARREAVAKMERVYRRLQARTLMRRWHVLSDAARLSQEARSRSKRLMSFKSSTRRLSVAGNVLSRQGDGADSADSVVAPTSISRASSAGFEGGFGAVPVPATTPRAMRMTLSRTEELRSLCALDDELESTVGAMNRAQLRRLVAGLDVLRRCGGNDAVLFETLGKHINAEEQLIVGAEAGGR
ncbi:hypothetical protein FNF27_03541 [Cafeteria roenbergensis]|uniref:Ion transport domain-containing protein n=1 Tax=Cafeteria roenbergensis TaxID=33653 RepID=A0A5A8EGD2_CAFRO|nr:hypothetical protein FNF27_03541 [Cafeteria roenbergensis]